MFFNILKVVGVLFCVAVVGVCVAASFGYIDLNLNFTETMSSLWSNHRHALGILILNIVVMMALVSQANFLTPSKNVALNLIGNLAALVLPLMVVLQGGMVDSAVQGLLASVLVLGITVWTFYCLAEDISEKMYPILRPTQIATCYVVCTPALATTFAMATLLSVLMSLICGVAAVSVGSIKLRKNS